MRFTNQLAFDWLLFNVYPIGNFVYKPACEFHCALLNFAMHLQSSEESLEHFSENVVEIDCNSEEIHGGYFALSTYNNF